MASNSDRGLLAKSLAGLKWNYAGTIARVVMQLVAQIAIARMIGVAEFGAASAAIFISAFCMLFVEMGLSSALVQAKSITHSDIRFTFTRTIQASVLIVGLLQLMAPWIAETVWQDSGVAELLRGMSVSILAQGCGLISLALLRRELDFKTIQITQTTSYFLGFVCTGVTAAYLGAGAWSLVLAWVVQSLVFSSLLYSKTRHPANLLPGTTCPNRNLPRYGYKILLTNLANWAIENLDNLLVGRAFGTKALGSYTVAYNLVRTPTNHLVTSIQQVLFPSSAKAGEIDDAYRDAYLALIWVLSLLVFPLFFSVAALAQPIILLIYGETWAETALILAPLALAMPFHALMAVGGPILWGRGKAAQEMRIQLAIAAVFLSLLLVLASTSAAVMAWGVAGMYIVRCMALQLQVISTLSIRMGDIVRAVFPGLVVGLISLVTFRWLDNSVSIAHQGALARMGAAAVCSVLGLLSMALLLRFLIPARLASAMAASNYFPDKMRKWLGVQ